MDISSDTVIVNRLKFKEGEWKLIEDLWSEMTRGKVSMQVHISFSQY